MLLVASIYFVIQISSYILWRNVICSTVERYFGCLWSLPISKAYLLTFLLINKVIALTIDSKQFKINRYWRFNSKSIVKILNCFLLLLLLDDLSYFLNIKKGINLAYVFSAKLSLYFFPRASKISELLGILNNYF